MLSAVIAGGILEDNLPHVTSFDLISSARVPLIKLKFPVAELSVDIIVNDMYVLY